MSDAKVKDKRSPKEKLKQAYKMIVAAVVTSNIIFYVGINNVPNDTSGLKSSADRLLYTVRWLMFSGLAVLGGVISVGNVRGSTSAVDPIEGGAEHLVDVPNRILRNTVEQTLIHVLGLLGLTSYLEPENMNVIPILVVIFVFGRFFFYYGYHMRAMNRGYGFAMTFLPSVAVYFYCMYQFFKPLVFSILE